MLQTFFQVLPTQKTQNKKQPFVMSARCNLQSLAAKVHPAVPCAAKIARSIVTACISGNGLCCRAVSEAISLVLDEAQEVRKEYVMRFERGQTKEGMEYSNLYKEASAFLNTEQRPEKTGELFPGRPLCRPRIHFDNARSHPDAQHDDCSKQYRNSQSHSPGLFTVQCVCSNPKLLGVSVMNSSESLSIATSTILSRFSALPRTIFYDNSCNLTKSLVLRFPWVLNESRIVCDRFHYKSHTCSSAYDPDSYPFLDWHQTSGAESLNSRWASSRSHIRFLNSDNLMPFLTSKAIFINLRAMMRQKQGITDTEDSNLVAFGGSVLICNCERCKKRLKKVQICREFSFSVREDD